MPVQNAVNYYYLELGTVGVSDVIAIEVIPSGNKGYQIRPHPVVDQARIYFDPIAHDGHVLKVYDLAGREVLSSETLDAYFDMNTATLPSGLYPFTITSSGNSARIEGIFLVQH
jgi:hypothetical protein